MTTNITSSGLGTVVTPSGNVTTITGGTRPGNGPNLFHSFGSFSVGEGNTANFSNNSGLPTANILSRVTGGQVSNIDGILRTNNPLNPTDPLNFGGANLWLINPAGVIFGRNASLQVGGSFSVSTADYLRMTDGAMFHADLGKQSTLSIAPVAAFGFLGPSPGKIAVNGSTLSGADGTTLALVGGEVSIVGGTLQVNTKSASGGASLGRIALGSVTSSGEVLIDLNNQVRLDHNPVLAPVKPILTLQDGVSRGTVKVIQGSTLKVDAGGSIPLGDIQIVSGRFVLADGSKVLAEVSVLAPVLFPFNDTSSGRIAIDAKNSALVTGDSRIDVGGRVSGRINVTGGSLQVENSLITTGDIGSGESSGAIFNVKSLTLLNGGRIENFGGKPAFGPPHDFTAMTVDATDSVLISGRNANGVPSGLSTGFGSIQVSTQALVIRDGGIISSSTAGLFQAFPHVPQVGLAGDIRIDAKDTIAISGPSGVFSSTTPNTFGVGGSLTLTARQIALNDGGTIESISAGFGDAGTIAIVATDSFTSKAGQVITELRQGLGSFGFSPPCGRYHYPGGSPGAPEGQPRLCSRSRRFRQRRQRHH